MFRAHPRDVPGGRIHASEISEATCWVKVEQQKSVAPAGQRSQLSSCLGLSVAFIPDGHTLATGSIHHIVLLWDLTPLEDLRRAPVQEPFTCAGASLDTTTWGPSTPPASTTKTPAQTIDPLNQRTTAIPRKRSIERHGGPPTLNHWPLLATRTPIQVAPGVPRGDDVGSAHQTWRTGPAVDVDLTAMPILTRRSSHHHRVMLRTDCIDPAMTHPIAHQLDEI